MFSSASKYAIRAVLFLAIKSNNKHKWGSTDIARELEVKKPYLSKVLQELARKKLISSSKGPNGGFYLNKTNRMNNLMEILNCFDDLGSFESCVLGFDDCSDANPCPLHVQAFAYREGLRYQFIHQTIDDLAKKMKRLQLKI